MKEEIKKILANHRDIIMREAKQDVSKDRKEGYMNGVLDMYNKSIQTIDNHIVE